jgi:hypothetical protein
MGPGGHDLIARRRSYSILPQPVGRPALLIALKDELIKQKPRPIVGSLQPLEPLDDWTTGQRK